MKKLSIIISNYCTKGLIEKNINNLLDNWENCEIIFVDNDSPDGSADFVEEKFGNNPKVTLIKTENNGLAAAYNLGLEKATGDYYLYLGTDAFPSGESLERIVSYMEENSDVGVVTAKIYTRDNVIDLDSHRGFPTPWVALSHFLYLDKLFSKSKLFSGYNMGYKDLDTIHEIDACISHFMFVRPEVHTKIGKWDEGFWLFGEDIDFCYRVKQAGYKIIFMGNTPVLHYKGAAVGRATSSDIDSVMNTEFDEISYKGEKIQRTLKKDRGSRKKEKKKVTSTVLFMKIKIAKESTSAMRRFYKKHYAKKYPFFLTWLVFIGIWVNEKIKIFKVLKKVYL